jgi:hypothetical protein
MSHITTKDWLMSLLQNSDNSCITRNGILWKSVAGFSQCGCVFTIYQNDDNYCVHSADEWRENEEPNMGYYDKPLSYDELISEIANTYDKIREKIVISNPLHFQKQNKQLL